VRRRQPAGSKVTPDVLDPGVESWVVRSGSRGFEVAGSFSQCAFALHLAQAQSNCGPRVRKRDFPDAERLVKRLVARELTLSRVLTTVNVTR